MSIYQRQLGYQDFLNSLKYNRILNLNHRLYRIFDIVFATTALTISAPIMLIIALLIKLNSPNGDILFKQKRLGLNGKLFEVYKFRTMIPNAENVLNEMLNKNPKLEAHYIKYRKIKNDPRIIPNIGSFLRKTSLDELPQFFNVLMGQMSIVGPRPYIESEFNVYDSKTKLQLVTSVKPGITGFWQTIPQRHNTTFKERVESDICYVKNKSILLDLRIIVKTVYVMVLRKGE